MRTPLHVIVLVTLALASSGCGRGHVFAGPPAVGQGARVEVREAARLDGDELSVRLLAFSDTDEKIEINRNQIAVVAPDGREFFRQGGREIHWLPARGQHPINLDVRIDEDAFRGASGVYLRFDGFYVGTMRLDIPPMALGKPKGGPGSTNTSFAAKGEGAEKSLKDAVLAKVGVSRGKSEAKGDDTIQQYRGPRRMLKNQGVKCAAMPLKSKDVAEQMTFIMDELLLTELQQSGFEAIGPDDINALIGFERTKEAVGCDDMACAAEIGSALGVEYLAAGNVAQLEGSMVLTLKLLDTRAARVVARVNKVAEGGQKGLPRLIAEAVQELVERSSL